MNNKDPTVFAAHILECIEKVQEYTEDITKKDFKNSTQLQDAIIRRVEIIGEAARNIPQEIQRKYPEIPWDEMKGMRNVLIHEYFGVDLDLTWEVAQKDLPDLKSQIISLKEELEGQ